MTCTDDIKIKSIDLHGHVIDEEKSKKAGHAVYDTSKAFKTITLTNGSVWAAVSSPKGI